MNYEEENYILDTLIEIQDFIRSPTYKQLVKETHENNLMLKQIINFINLTTSNANIENENDFGRNVLANLISNFNIKK